MNRLLCVIAILCCSQVAYLQVTLIPDSNFEQALIDSGIDSDGTINGQVLTSDISSVTWLDVSYKMIQDLTGIEDFTSLESLFCYDNLLTSLNTSNNLSLKVLYCGGNYFSTPLDLSNNTLLEELECAYCGLPSLDVSKNVLLEYLYCHNDYDLNPVNTISTLDLSNNINLKRLEAYDLHNLQGLDLSNNKNLERVNVAEGWANNPYFSYLNLKNGNNSILTYVSTSFLNKLLCIQVDDEVAATNGAYPYSEWFINDEASFSENCNYGISDYKKIKIDVYPNPVVDFLNINYDDAIKIISIKVFNVLGELILEKRNDFQQLNLEGLKEGVFFLKIKTREGTLTDKLIKTR